MPAPVLVVGAGPAGLTVAHELARRGVGVRIIERAPVPSPHSRALVLHCRTQELMEDAGLRDNVAEHAIELRGMTFRRGGRRLATVPYDLGRYPALSLPQPQTESVLAGRLEQLGVKVERGRELVGIKQQCDALEVTIGNDTMTAAFVVGCDGAHSTVRRLADIPFEGDDLPEIMWMADARLDWDLQPDRVWQLLHSDGMLSAIPMPAGLWRLVTLRTLDEGEPTGQFFERAIVARTSAKPRRLDIKWTSTFRVSCRLASAYGRGRVLLAGDAAHIHSPIGGQGMNLAIQDAFCLARRLAAGIASPPEAILEPYQLERRPVAAAVMRTNARVTRLAMSTGPVQRLVRDHVMPRLLSLSPIARRAGLEAAGLQSHT